MALSAILQDHLFFKERQLKPNFINEMLFHMEIEMFSEQETVLEVGEKGDFWYFIIEGIVEIRIPDPTTIQLYKDLSN